jgi:hypothetical protein
MMVKKVLIAAAVAVTACVGTAGAYAASPKHTQDQVRDCVHGVLFDADHPTCDLAQTVTPR